MLKNLPIFHPRTTLILIKEGSHSTADEITKQINDKERVAAALENPSLKSTVEECINHEIV